MAAKDDIIESLHGSIELELDLSGILVSDLFRGSHRFHLSHPVGHCRQALVVSREVWVRLQSLLHVTQGWQQLIH